MGERIFVRTDALGRPVQGFMDPQQFSQEAWEEITTRQMEHGDLFEQTIFRVAKRAAHVSAEDLQDLRDMYRLGDFPRLLIAGIAEEMSNATRIAKKATSS